MRVAKYKLRDLIIACNKDGWGNKAKVLSLDGDTIYDPIPRALFNAIGSVRHKWLVYLACIRIERNGKERLVVVPAPAPFEVFHTEINDSLAEKHRELLQEEMDKGNEIGNVGWLAVANGSPLTDEEVNILFQDKIKL